MDFNGAAEQIFASPEKSALHVAGAAHGADRIGRLPTVSRSSKICSQRSLSHGIGRESKRGVDQQPAAAERYFDRIEAKAELLKSQPRMGVRRSDIRPSMRMLVEAPYLLLYRTDPDIDEGPISAVEIVRVVDGRRDLHSLL